MTKCISCQHFSLNSALGKYGFGSCAHQSAPEWNPSALYERVCGKFTAASEEEMTARRIQWKERRKEEQK